MHLLKFSIDNMSLMALTLSVGFVVDDAIVVIENIVRHLEAGEDGMGAALKGSREIVFTIISMTISLVAVFIPVLFMSGIVGRLFNEFAVTMAVAILISGFVSLSLTPMLCSRFLKAPDLHKSNKLYRASEAIFDGMMRIYERTLRSVLSHPRLAVLSFLMLLLVTGYLFAVMPKGFMPNEDTDKFMGLPKRRKASHLRTWWHTRDKLPISSGRMKMSLIT